MRLHEMTDDEFTFWEYMQMMIVPLDRQDPTPENAKWFLEEGDIKNSEHPQFAAAEQAAEQLI